MHKKIIALALTLAIFVALVPSVASAGNGINPNRANGDGPKCEASDGLLNAVINSAIDDSVVNEDVLYNYFDAGRDCHTGG